MLSNIMLSKEQQGLIACIASGILWGVGVLFWPLLSYLSPVSILSLRLIFSFFFALVVVYLTSRFDLVTSLFQNKKTLQYLIIATIFLCLNWGFYIYAINSEKAIEVSLGYYLTPLMNIAFGRIFFNDVLNKNQVIAIGLVIIGVSYGIISYGEIPYLGLIIGSTFAIYGFLHKIINADAISLLFAETMIILPFSCLWLYATEPQYGIIGYDMGHYCLLVGTIFFTGIPLILFTYATITVRLTTLGFMLYLSPSINFLLAVFYTHEAIKPSDYITFPVVWIALCIYTFDMLHKIKKVH